ncbi:intermembrane phospholipid transport protein YdbH family protein [Microbulbifer hainanensis]|uniref:intermembrane phospholipid transport protein YdbH family protein n=1 Tax=Microbulbifer hainanensis TaxID=2735675 RepID=UPI00186945D7|nr:YdbH domain-containing protein [Microbulbifer hainanensis]
MNLKLRKSIVFSTALAVLLAVLLWLWLDRDRMTPTLLNPFLQGSRIQELQELHLAPRKIGAKTLTLVLADGATLQVQDLQLHNPLDLLFGSRNNRSRLSASQLIWTPAPDDTAPQKNARAIGTPDLSLHDLLQQLQRYLPNAMQIRQWQWRGAEPITGELQAQRNNADESAKVQISADGRQLKLDVRWRGEQFQFGAQIVAANGESIATLNGALNRDSAQSPAPQHWRGELTATARLDQFKTLPIPPDAVARLAGARGDVTMTVSGQLPDRLLQLDEYRDIAAEVRTESARLPVPDSTLGVPLELSLKTVAPFTVRLASVRPLQPEEIAGRGDLEITAENESAPLLWATISADDSAGQAKITVDGTLDFAAASGVLKAPPLQDALSPLVLDTPSGSARLHGSASLPALNQIDRDTAALRDIAVTLLPASTLKVSVTEKGQPGKVEPLLAPFNWRSGTAQVQLTEPLTVTAPTLPGKLQLEGGKIKLHLQEQRGTPLADIALSALSCELTDDYRCTLSASAQLPELSIPADNITVKDLALDSHLTLKLTDTEQRWQLQQLAVTADRLALETVSADNIAFRAGKIVCVDSGAPTCHSPSVDASVATLKGDDFEVGGTVGFTDVQFSRENLENRASARFHTDPLQLRLQGKYKADVSISGQLALTGDRVHGDSEVQSGAVTLKAAWQHDLQKNRGSAQLDMPAVTFSQGSPLSQSIAGLPVDIVAGTLTAGGNVSWPQLDGDQLRATLDQVAATHGDIFAVGASGQLAATHRDGHWLTPEPQPMRLDTLDVGLPIEKIRFTIGLNGDQDLTLGNISAELLDGKLHSKAVVWNLAGEERRSEVDIEGISLRNLADEMDAENFAASGTLDLQVPLITGKDGITVEQGKVQARPPGGRLRYYGAFSPEVLASNPSLKLVAGALEDYNYRELSGTVEYPPSGDMQMALKLVGRSNSVAADRDLIINLNLENNVPDTLRSLQASRDLTEALEKKLQ